MKRFLLVIMLMVTSTYCSGDYAQIEPQLSNEVILDAKVIGYRDLPEEVRSSYSLFHPSYSKNGGWTSLDLVSFEAKSAFYVKLSISREPLAKLVLANNSGRRRTREEFEMVVSSAMSGSKDYPLYGKYVNSWVFSSGNNLVPSTEKFDGHHVLKYEISEDKKTDYLLIGPLPLKPTAVEIDLFSKFGGLKNPKREIQ